MRIRKECDKKSVREKVNKLKEISKNPTAKASEVRIEGKEIESDEKKKRENDKVIENKEKEVERKEHERRENESVMTFVSIREE